MLRTYVSKVYNVIRPLYEILRGKIIFIKNRIIQYYEKHITFTHGKDMYFHPYYQRIGRENIFVPCVPSYLQREIVENKIYNVPKQNAIT